MNGLAIALQSQKKLDAALPICREALAMRQRLLPGDHREVATGLNNLAFLLGLRGDRVEAERLYRDALAMRRRLFAGDHRDVETSLTNLACLLRDGGDTASAEPLFREALAVAQRVYADDHPDLASACENLAGVLRGRRDFAGAEPLQRQALAIRARRFPGDHALVVRAKIALAETFRELGKLDEALVLQRALLDGARAALGADSQGFAVHLATMASTLLGLQQWTEAEQFAREALRVREAKTPEDWRTDNTRSLLGGALLGQRRFADAEPLLLAGCRGMLARTGATPPPSHGRIVEALERLVQLYEATGNTTEAAVWRTELGARRAAGR